MPETFSPATWADGSAGGTPITAAQLNRIEQGVETIDDRVAALETPLVHAVGNSGSALTLNPTVTGYIKTITLTANCTFTLTGATAGTLTVLELILTQDATGGRTVTWPGSVRWSGGVPVLTTTANGVDRLVLSSYDGGTIWYGDVIGKAYA